MSEHRMTKQTYEAWGNWKCPNRMNPVFRKVRTFLGREASRALSNDLLGLIN